MSAGGEWLRGSIADIAKPECSLPSEHLPPTLNSSSLILPLKLSM